MSSTEKEDNLEKKQLELLYRSERCVRGSGLLPPPSDPCPH